MGPLTITQPFTLASRLLDARLALPVRALLRPAVVSDTGIGARLAAGTAADAPLAAVQLVAELSLIYYEVPNLLGPGGTPAPRGVVGVAPLAWAPSPTFVTTLLTDLQGNPVIAPVTLDQLFAQVAVGADGQPPSRHTVTTASSPSTSSNPTRRQDPASGRGRRGADGPSPSGGIRQRRGREPDGRGAGPDHR